MNKKFLLSLCCLLTCIALLEVVSINVFRTSKQMFWLKDNIQLAERQGVDPNQNDLSKLENLQHSNNIIVKVVANLKFDKESFVIFSILSFIIMVVLFYLATNVLVIRPIKEWLEHKAFERWHRRRQLFYLAIDLINSRRDDELLEG